MAAEKLDTDKLCLGEHHPYASSPSKVLLLLLLYGTRPTNMVQ